MEKFEPIERSSLAPNERPTTIEGTVLNEKGEVTTVSGKVLKVTAQNPWATVEIGQWPDGHRGHRVAQTNPGAVMVVYARVPREKLNELNLNPDNPLDAIVVSLVAETRQNLSSNGLVLCVPGGFTQPQEGTERGAKREFTEETGGPVTSPPEKMNGHEIVPNRNFDDLRKGRGNDIFVSNEPVDFQDLQQTNSENEGLALCNKEVRLWKHPNLEGNKGQPVYFVSPHDSLKATPDSLALDAVLAAMVHSTKKE